MILFFVIGTIFGSFLNVIIYRLKARQNIVFGGSFCPECKTKLKWYDLVPFLSFLFLHGNCRYCHKKISWQYPIVEILSGLIWVSVAYKSNFQFFPLGGIPHSGTIFNFQYLNIFYYIFIFSALLIIAVYDFKWRIIPDKIVYPAITVTLIYNVSPPDKGGLWGVFIPSIYRYRRFFIFLLIFYFSKGKAMGLGDAKLAFLIGLFLSPWLTFAAFTLAFIIGGVFGIILIGLGKKTFKSQIAFGPFLILGTAIAFFFFNFINKI